MSLLELKNPFRLWMYSCICYGISTCLVIYNLPIASKFSFPWSVQHFIYCNLSMTSPTESNRAHGELPGRYWLREREKSLWEFSGINACLASFGEDRWEAPSPHLHFIFLYSIVPVLPFVRGRGLEGYPVRSSEMTACVLLYLSEAIWEQAKTGVALRAI